MRRFIKQDPPYSTIERTTVHTQKRPLKTLERVLSKAGIGSRVEARSWIHAGRVQVNGKVIRNPDHWVDMQRDRVRFDGKPLVARERLDVLLYKPTGYLTTYTKTRKGARRSMT